MGTLDDAIREHLELKRRGGAGNDEVTRLEHEALGPARREPPAPADAPPPQGDQPAAPREEPVSGEAVPPPPPPAPPEPAGREPAEAPADTWLDDEDDEPELPAATHPPAEPRTGGSHAMSSSDHVEPDEEGEDLLEETPDFLQETPEHDRLWFEQKPPRDFDFE